MRPTPFSFHCVGPSAHKLRPNDRLTTIHVAKSNIIGNQCCTEAVVGNVRDTSRLYHSFTGTLKAFVLFCNQEPHAVLGSSAKVAGLLEQLLPSQNSPAEHSQLRHPNLEQSLDVCECKSHQTLRRRCQLPIFHSIHAQHLLLVSALLLDGGFCFA